MKRLLLLTLACFCFAVVAQAADGPQTQLTTRGKSLLSDDFATGLGGKWKAGKGKWTADDKAVRVAQVKADMHGAVARHDLAFTSAVISLEFKLDGVKMTSISLNGAKGHIGRVMVTPKQFSVNKDDQDGKDGPDKGEVLAKTELTIKPGEWHTLVVECHGAEMLATLDGKHHAYGKHPALDQPKKNIGLTAAGETVCFRNFQVYEATANPSWDTIKPTIVK